MKNIIIFDMDGTILNTLEDISAAVNYSLSAFNWPERTQNHIRKALGNGVKALISACVPANTLEEELLKCVEVFKGYYSQNMHNKTRPYSGICQLCNELKNKNYHLAVVSNKFDSAVKELCNIYFEGLFDIAIGESPQVRKKPEPDGVLAALKELGADKSAAVYIGDSEVDYTTALNAGIDAICVTWGFRDKEELSALGAKVFADKPSDILDLLQSM